MSTSRPDSTIGAARLERFERPVHEALAAAAAAGRRRLTEPEALAVARALGLRVPRHVLVEDPAAAAVTDLSAFPGERVVLKLVSATIAHKSDVGGVRVVRREPAAVAAAVAEMLRAPAAHDARGIGIYELVEHDSSLGGEILAGVRFSAEFGPLVCLGLGGTGAEFLQRHLRPDRGVVCLAPFLARRPGYLERSLEANPLTGLACDAFRGRAPLVAREVLRAFVERLCAFAERFVPRHLTELEINPLVFAEGGLVALDALATLGDGTPAPTAPSRPLHKLERLLRPRSMAVIGVSDRPNPGRVILENTLAAGFPAERLQVVKPGRATLAGCRCWPDVDALPEPVDLCVLAIDAASVPATLERIVAGRKAESVILIPGGLGEGVASTVHAADVERLLRESRRTAWGGPLVNGGNCLGLRSGPGRCDTLFVPRHKFPAPAGPAAPVAVIAQSGAFVLARLSRLAFAPRYVVSVGNQIDLTVADYLIGLADDPELRCFACYVEGFRPGDGARFVEAAARIADAGKTVILYRAGRTPAGVRASASHTASIAGDWEATRQLAAQAGVLVCAELADFEDLLRVSCALAEKEVRGRRLGALSNAGFECVALADNLGSFELERFEPRTERELAALFARHRLAQVVGVQNPLDVTPILDDAAFAEAARAVLADGNVDVAVLGCVPHTGALCTLSRTAVHGAAVRAADVRDASSVAQRLASLRDVSPKAWIAVVDAGPLYEDFARLLEDHGVPVFRSADRALRTFEKYCAARLGSTTRVRRSS